MVGATMTKPIPIQVDITLTQDNDEQEEAPINKMPPGWVSHRVERESFVAPSKPAEPRPPIDWRFMP
jgi:hypothetical protein